MDTGEKLKNGQVAAFAARPGRTRAQAGSTLNYWRTLGIVPHDGEVPAPGGKAFLYPQWTGAIFAVLCDLHDAGVVTAKDQLRGMWRFLAEPHGEGIRPHIEHILDAIAAGECCFLVMTMWRDEVSGAYQPTCATRFEDEYDKPIASPTPRHDPVAEYVINLHVLLKRFATKDSNVQPLRTEG